MTIVLQRYELLYSHIISLTFKFDTSAAVFSPFLFVACNLCRISS